MTTLKNSEISTTSISEWNFLQLISYFLMKIVFLYKSVFPPADLERVQKDREMSE
jgi:hypothetical protein